MLDAHCHVDLYDDPFAVVRECERLNIITVAVTNLPSHFEMGYSHLQRCKNVRQALGLHPLMASQHRLELPKFKRLAETSLYIGEIGLDFSRQGISTKDIQLESFRFALSCLQDRPRFITLHSRGAESAVLDILIEQYIQQAVFHWYTGPLTILDRALKAGHYFSVNPLMTRSANGQAIIARIDSKRLLTESDGPYAQIKGSLLKPTDVQIVHQYLSKAWQLSTSEVERQVNANFQSLLSNLG